MEICSKENSLVKIRLHYALFKKDGRALLPITDESDVFPIDVRGHRPHATAPKPIFSCLLVLFEEIYFRVIFLSCTGGATASGDLLFEHGQ